MITSSNRLTNAEYRQLHTRAEKLRKQGLSYKEIHKQVPVSKSSLSLWCRDIPLSKKQIERLGKRYDTQLRGAKANQKKSKERKQAVRQYAINEISKPNDEMLKIAGALLYWAEGCKTVNTAIANSDPAFIVFFVKWFEQILDIKPEQLVAHLHLHKGQSDKKEKKFWSELTGIPIDNFGKTFYKPIGTGHRKNTLYHGTVRIRVKGKGVVLLRHKILAWAEGFIRHTVPQEIIDIHYCSKMGR